MDISTKAGGLRLANPLIVSSGPMTGNDERILSLKSQGLGGIITKTMAPEAAEVLRPCIAVVGNRLYNCELWSEYPAKDWIDTYLPNVRKQMDTPIIVSVGYDGEDFKKMIPFCEEFNLADAYEYPPRYTHDYVELGKGVAALRKLTAKPIWVKVSNSVGNIIEFVRACVDSGVTAIATTSSQGPQLAVDIARRRPLIGTPEGHVWASGTTVKNTALAYVNIIKEAFPDLSVIGSGGAVCAEDIIEFLLAGADAVELLTVAMLNGRSAFGKIIADLPATLEKYGFSSVEDVKRTGLTKSAAPLVPSFPIVDYKKCTRCGLCTRCCSYLGIKMQDGRPVADESNCFGCGQCQSRCPVNAISNVY